MIIPVSRSQTKEVSDSNRTDLNQWYQSVTHTLALRFTLEKILQKILACAKRNGKGRERGKKARKGKGRWPLSPTPIPFSLPPVPLPHFIRGTQREILRKRPKNNNKAWIKVSETILSILGDCWKKIICSSLPARLMEEFPASNLTTCNLTYWEVS